MRESLTAGRHVLCLNIETGGFYIKSITFKLKEESGIQSIVNSQWSSANDPFGSAASFREEWYDLQGRKVDNSYKGIVIRNGKKVLNR
jgi:hypothetical protein